MTATHNVRIGYDMYFLSAVQHLDVTDQPELARIKAEIVAKMPISPNEYFVMEALVRDEAARLKTERESKT